MVLFVTIIFVASLLTIVSLISLKLAKGQHSHTIRISKVGLVGAPESLWAYIWRKAKIGGRKLWHFILEAKDLAPAKSKNIQDRYQRVKKAFRIKIRSSETDPHWLPEATELVEEKVAQKNPEDLYLEAIRRNPNDKQSYEALGRLYLQNKNFGEAAETYEYLTKLDPRRDSYFSNLGFAYYSAGEFAQAASAYEKALSINNKIPTRWINLAMCFEGLDDHSRAVKAFTQALQLDKMNTSYMMLMADAYLKIPNPVRAEEVLEQILALEPTNKSAREKLMRLKI